MRPCLGHAPGGRLLLEFTMSSSTYRLMVIHRSLDESIHNEMKRKLPDSFRLLRLKKMKLAVKDRLSALMRRGVAA